MSLAAHAQQVNVEVGDGLARVGVRGYQFRIGLGGSVQVIPEFAAAGRHGVHVRRGDSRRGR